MSGYSQKPRANITGAQCRALRQRLRWTQPRLAAEARVALNTISEFENGTWQRPYSGPLIEAALNRAINLGVQSGVTEGLI